MEGAVDEGGRGTSIWDTFCRTPGRIRGGDTGDAACDQYHRYPQDVALMAELGIRAYRFSVAWPRIQPEGSGAPNQEGLDHYRRLVDTLNTHGIAPVLTLYHWDLPQALEDAGGWPNRDTAMRFADYAGIVHQALAGEVELWITLNEPWCSAWLGYGSDIHAPGRDDPALAWAATHHLLLGHGLAMQAMSGAGEVGIALNLQPTRPGTEDPADVRAARLADLQMNAMYLDPLFGRGYPAELVEHYGRAADPAFVREGDLETIAAPIDFVGVNYYRRFTIVASPSAGAEELPGSVGAWSVIPPGVAVTGMGWPIEPDGLTEVLTRVHRDSAASRVYVTETGAAFDDEVDAAGEVRDDRRIAYLRDHAAQAHAALESGVPLQGFFVWSLLDNFEWAEGYSKRFGLVHVDFASQRRTPRASARWYRDAIARS